LPFDVCDGINQFGLFLQSKFKFILSKSNKNQSQ